MNVLLVEDEAELADVIARNLRAHGHAVRIEMTAETALLRMAEVWPEALILDVNLPDLTGWEVLRRLSGADREKLSVIVVSAAPLSQKRIAELQPLRWLQKPFPMDAMIRLLDEAASARRAATPAGQKEES